MMELKPFAVAVYSRTGIAEACLSLQDQNHADVPLLLFCGWYGAFFGCLTPEHVQRARQLAQLSGDHVIKPLRQVRRWMKTHSLATGSAQTLGNVGSDQHWNSLRDDIKSAELKAELFLLDTLAAMTLTHTGSAKGDQEATPTETQTILASIQYNLRLLVSNNSITSQTVNLDPNEDLLTLIGAACFDTAHSG